MRTLDIPQANDLDTVRAVVRAVINGADRHEAVADFTGFSPRHTRYRLEAARILGLLTEAEGVLIPTALGQRLIDAPLHSDGERGVYFDAINRSRPLQVIVPDLLGAVPPSLTDLTDRLAAMSRLARSTAERRASGLLTWRRRVLDLHSDNQDQDPAPPGDPQLDLFR